MFSTHTIEYISNHVENSLAIAKGLKWKFTLFQRKFSQEQRSRPGVLHMHLHVPTTSTNHTFTGPVSWLLVRAHPWESLFKFQDMQRDGGMWLPCFRIVQKKYALPLRVNTLSPTEAQARLPPKPLIHHPFLLPSSIPADTQWMTAKGSKFPSPLP